MHIRSTLLLGILWTLLSTGHAQTLRVGVVLSQTGQARLAGSAQANALRALEARSAGADIELFIRDDGSSPVAAAAAVQTLVETEEVHALICCTTPAATEGVSRYVEDAGVLTLSLSELPAEANPWLFTLEPDAQRLLQSVILKQAASAKTRFALMTLNNDFGDEVEAALERLISPEAGVQLVAQQRYRPNVSVLTPEALWVATRLPETVLVWGFSPDVSLAYAALRARGYEGDSVLSPLVLEPSARTDLARLVGALLPLSPVRVASTLPLSHPTAEATGAYFRLMASSYGPGRVPPEGAAAYDALLLLREAFAQAFSYGVALEETSVFRSALRDAFVSMSPVTGASAVYDYGETDPIGVVPTSLVLGRVVAGGLEYAE